MFLARWIIDVKFGHKDAFKESIKKWQNQVGDQAGLEPNQVRWLTGSIGAAESRFEMEFTVESLEQLEKIWAELPKIPAHQEFGKSMSELVVSGSNRWEVLRIVEV